MEFNVQAPHDQQNETNPLANQSQNQNIKNLELVSEEQEKLFEEKLQLVEQRKELRKLVFDLLQENMMLDHQRILKEKAFIKSEKNVKTIAEVIGSRLSYVYDLALDRIKVYDKYVKYSFKRLHDRTFLNNDEVLLQQKQSKLDDMYSTFEEQLDTLEKLMATDYENECRKNIVFFHVVMKECNEVEDSCYNLTCMILED